MPTIKFQATASADDALSGRKFKTIPETGAILNLWATGDDEGDSVGLSIGDREIMVESPCNLETQSGTVKINEDQLIFNEIVGGGELFMPLSVTTAMDVLLHIRYL